jgi:hypothetical protein
MYRCTLRKETGAVVLSSATTVAEARWLEAHGVDVVIAQGLEAGGHRGSFLGAEPFEPGRAIRAAAAGRSGRAPARGGRWRYRRRSGHRSRLGAWRE